MPDDLLPPNATPQERALSLAADRLPDAPVKHLWNPQTCPAGILPWLAWALSVDEWDPAWPEQTQRNTIAASIEQHRRKGTIGALRQALARLGYEVEIDEQTGAAYTFGLKVKLGPGESAGGELAMAKKTRATETALKMKNVRSELVDTIFAADAGDAAVYVGGAPISGAVVEIGNTAEPLPLDGYNDNLIASAWTTRMHSSYSGPIARVRRASDSAEMDYYSVAELAAFVDGTAWEFVRFFNQATRGVPTRISLMDGGFDANGIPIIIPDGTLSSAIVILHDAISGPEVSMVFAAKAIASSPGGHANLWLTTDNIASATVTDWSLVVGNSQNVFYNIPRGASQRTTASTDSPTVFGGIFGTGYRHIRYNATTNTSASAYAWPQRWRKSLLSLAAVSAGDTNGYGFAVWNKNIGITDLTSIMAAATSSLQF